VNLFRLIEIAVIKYHKNIGFLKIIIKTMNSNINYLKTNTKSILSIEYDKFSIEDTLCKKYFSLLPTMEFLICFQNDFSICEIN
jgi:hypothetical protein